MEQQQTTKQEVTPPLVSPPPPKPPRLHQQQHHEQSNLRKQHNVSPVEVATASATAKNPKAVTSAHGATQGKSKVLHFQSPLVTRFTSSIKHNASTVAHHDNKAAASVRSKPKVKTTIATTTTTTATVTTTKASILSDTSRHKSLQSSGAVSEDKNSSNNNNNNNNNINNINNNSNNSSSHTKTTSANFQLQMPPALTVKNRLAQGCTRLMYACQQGDTVSVLEQLRTQPERIRQRDSHYKSALHYCAGQPENQRDLVAAASIAIAAPDLLESADEDGFTPLHLAVIQGNLAMVNLLLANKADVNAVDNEGHSVVHWATVCGEIEALRAVLTAGANVSTPDINGGSPLHYAAQMCGASYEGKLNKASSSKLAMDILAILLAHPESMVDQQDKDGRQPLLWAASAGSAKAVIALVKAGARVESADKDGLTALHCAASRGHTECIDTLISLCGAPTDLIDSNGCTALHYAVTLGHADATARLLELEADPNRQDRKGRTPAHCGCSKGQFETVKLLKERGANLWLRNAKGDLPVHEAASSGRRELVEWLLAQRPKQVNTTSNDGRSLMHIAAANDYTDMCKMLLDYGADINAVYRNSKAVLITPLDCALQKAHRSTAKFMQSNGGLPATKLKVPLRRSNHFQEATSDVVRPLKYAEKEELHDLRNSKKYVVYLKRSDSDGGENSCSCNEHTYKKEQRYTHVCRRHQRSKRHNRRRTSSCGEAKALRCGHHRDSGSDICRSKSNIELRRRKSRERYASSSEYEDEEEDADSCENCCYHKRQKQRVIKRRSLPSTRRSKDSDGDNSDGGKQEKSRTSDVKSKPLKYSMVESESTKEVIHQRQASMQKHTPPGSATKNGTDVKVAPTSEAANDNTKAQAKPDSMTDDDEEQSNKTEVVQVDVHHGADEVLSAASMKMDNEVEEQVKVSDENITGEHASNGEIVAESSGEHVASSNGENVATSTTEESEKKLSEAVLEEVSKEVDQVIDVAAHTLSLEESEKTAVDVGKPQKIPSVTDDEKVDTTSTVQSRLNSQDKSEEVIETSKNVDGSLAAEHKVETEPESKRTIESTTSESLDPQTLAPDSLQTEPEASITSTPLATNEAQNDASTTDLTTTDAPQLTSESKTPPSSTPAVTPPSTAAAGDTTATVPATTANETSPTTPAPTVPSTPTPTSILKQTPAQSPTSTKAPTPTSTSPKPTIMPISAPTANKTSPSPPILPSTESAKAASAHSESEKTANNITSPEQQQREQESRRSFTLLPSDSADEEQPIRKSSFQVLKSDDSVDLDAGDAGIGAEEQEVEFSDTQVFKIVSKSHDFHGTDKGGREEDTDQVLGADDDGDGVNIPQRRFTSAASRRGVVEPPCQKIEYDYSSGRKRRLKKRIRSGGNRTRSSWQSVDEDVLGANVTSTQHHASSKDQDSGFEPSPRTTKSKIPTPRTIYTANIRRQPIYATLDGRSCSSRVEARKPGDKGACDMTAVTRSIQRNIRRYYMERKIFQHLLELKSLQIRSNKLNEAVLVKRAVDDYHKSCAALGGETGGRMRRYPYTEYTFKNFELFLYETLKSLQKPGTYNFQNINEVYEEAERRLSPDYNAYEKALQCTSKTHRCLHAAHAYTGIPCAAYIPMMNHHTMPKLGFGPYKKTGVGSFYLPKILASNSSCGGKVSLELSHGKSKQLISLPSEKLDSNKRYYVTFTVKDSQVSAGGDKQQHQQQLQRSNSGCGADTSAQIGQDNNERK